MKRGGSLLGSAFYPNQDSNNNIQNNLLQQEQYKKILSRLKSGPQRLKRFLIDYKKAQTQKQQFQCFREFKSQQQIYKKQRQHLRNQLQEIKNQSEHKYVKTQLIQVIKQQMNLQIQMNNQVQLKKKRKQTIVRDLQLVQGKSTRVNNALNDIIQKTQEIKQLSRSIEECLELLKIIGVILEQQGGQLDQVERLVNGANQNVRKAEKKIDIAKQNMKRATRKKCCIILFGLIAICLILVVLYGISVINI